VTCAPEGGAGVSVHVTAVESAFGGLYPEDAGLRPPARAKRASDANVTLEPVAAGEAGDALDCVELMKPQAALVIGKHTQLKSLSTRKPTHQRAKHSLRCTLFRETTKTNEKHKRKRNDSPKSSQTNRSRHSRL
jgi:hypothetical protein